MPSITTIHESLPYIDPPPTPSQRLAAESLIAAERALTPDDPYHALLPPAYTPRFTPALSDLLSSVSSSTKPRQPLRAIDLARYEASASTTTTTAADAASTLSRAYAQRAYLSHRRAHLALLDAYGKNAWLVGNAQLEAELAALEAELSAARRDVDLLTVERQRRQDGVAGEMRGLEDNWRRGVGRVLETEVAAEELRQKVLEARRQQS